MFNPLDFRKLPDARKVLGPQLEKVKDEAADALDAVRLPGAVSGRVAEAVKAVTGAPSEHFDPIKTIQKGGIAGGACAVGLLVESYARTQIPILNALPPGTVAVPVAGAVMSAFNAVKFWARRKFGGK
jgi:hypothetical protein